MSLSSAGRKQHILRCNSRSESPQNCIYIDTETDPVVTRPGCVEHRLRFGWLAYTRRVRGQKWSTPAWHRFSTQSEASKLITSLCRGHTRTYMFAHNAAFDYSVLDLFAGLPALGWTLRTAVINSPPVILVWRRAKTTLTALDTMNWWPTSLAAIGKSVGAPKMSMPSSSASALRWDQYCRRDVEVMMIMVQRWVEYLRANDLGGFAPTAAAQALRTYRHRFMQHEILIDDNNRALTLARLAYHGGRVECFSVGAQREKLTCLDVNSMYPAVMRSNPYPARLLTTASRRNISQLRQDVRRYCVVSDVEIETDIPAYAVLIEGKLVFPVGRFRCALTTPELIHALDADRVISAHRTAIYERAYLFRDWVDTMHDLRVRHMREGRDVDAALDKLLLNSLYGKFGQRGVDHLHDEVISDMTARSERVIDHDTGQRYMILQLGGLRQTLSYGGESRDSHPAIAAHVTAYGRMLLWSLMQRAGRANVKYCDTDCMWVTDDGLDRLTRAIHPTRLGSLKIEWTSSRVIIHGPKDYVVDCMRRIKGVRMGAREIEPGVFEQERWSGLRGRLARGASIAPTTEVQVKTLQRNYDKGIVCPDGTVSPIVLGSDS